MGGGPQTSSAVGRPSKYDSAYCEQAIEFLKDGYSIAAFAGEIGVTRSTVYQWMADHEEFSDAVKTGQAAAVLWWEKANRNLALSGTGNATAIIFGLKNRAPDDWRDKTETEHSGTLKFDRVARVIVDPQQNAA